MRLPAFISALVLTLGFAACEQTPAPLPFPTPAQRDLVVLMAPGPLTYTLDEGGKPSGFEYDLVQAFAQDVGVGVKVVPVPADQIPARLARAEAHFGAAWATPANSTETPANLVVASSRDVAVQHEASLPLDSVAELGARTVPVLAGSRQAATARRLQQSIPDLQVVEIKDSDAFALLESVAANRVEIALIDSAVLAIAQQFVPSLQASLELGNEQPLIWIFDKHRNPELVARVEAFLTKARREGLIARIEDRYLGHVRRLKNGDIVRFLEKTEAVLPRLRRHFVSAQGETGIDWRLLAALAYHESQWDAEATSPTGVRGIMMLTEDTADRLGVGNRLDPRESIAAGARYLALLRDQLPATVAEPDRTWQALAAYNLGPGHFNAGRNLARQLKADPDSWYDLKRILPLLAQPKYYERLKAGRARGGEAVILVENIRSYYDILARQEPARYVVAGPLAMQGGKGIRPPAR